MIDTTRKATNCKRQHYIERFFYSVLCSPLTNIFLINITFSNSFGTLTPSKHFFHFNDTQNKTSFHNEKFSKRYVSLRMIPRLRNDFMMKELYHIQRWLFSWIRWHSSDSMLKDDFVPFDRRENISSELQVLQLWPRESISIVVSMFQNTNQVQYFKFIWLQYTYFIFTYSTYRFSRRSNKRLPTAASIAPHSSTQFGIIGIHEWNLQVSEAVRRRQRESLPTSLRSGGCALPLWRAPRSTPGSSSNQQGRADRL